MYGNAFPRSSITVVGSREHACGRFPARRNSGNGVFAAVIMQMRTRKWNGTTCAQVHAYVSSSRENPQERGLLAATHRALNAQTTVLFFFFFQNKSFRLPLSPISDGQRISIFQNIFFNTYGVHR
jgi:hypothetical protein